jgi:hypothetical protein
MKAFIAPPPGRDAVATPEARQCGKKRNRQPPTDGCGFTSSIRRTTQILGDEPDAKRAVVPLGDADLGRVGAGSTILGP